MYWVAICRQAAAAITILLVACGPRPSASVAGPEARPAVIPWISTAAGPEPTPSPTPIAGPLNMPFCRASDLSVRVGRSGVAAGTTYTSLVFTNRGSSTCQLQGVPLVELLDAGGQGLSVPQVDLPDGALAPVALRPGISDGGGVTPAVQGQGRLDVGFPSELCLARPSSTMVIALPNGSGQLQVAWTRGASSSLGCGREVFVLPFADAIPRPPAPIPPPDFAVEYILPASVGLGQTLKYEVRLKNIAGRAIRFTSCPGYTEGLKRAQVKARYLLNCQPVGLLSPGDSATFDMELSIPVDLPRAAIGNGPDYLSWWLDWPFQAVNRSGPALVTLTAS